MWFVGWASEDQEDFTTVDGIEFKNTTKGPDFRPLTYTAAEFDKLSAQADELVKLVDRLWGAVQMKTLKGSALTQNFVVDTDGTVHVPPGC
jgi:hypothetical protein